MTAAVGPRHGPLGANDAAGDVHERPIIRHTEVSRAEGFRDDVLQDGRRIPEYGESIHVDNIRIATAKENKPPAATKFRVTGTDLEVSGVRELGKLLKSDELHDQLKATIGRMDTLLDKINEGQGTLGQLLLNPALYESLDGTTRELQSLLKDFRANPKKFLRIRVGLF